jgi:hypothetical protein
MDPLTAFGLASNILQFIDFSAGVISNAREAYKSATGATEANTSLEIRVQEMKNLSMKLIPPDSASQSEDKRAVCRLAIELFRSSDEMVNLLAKMKPKKLNSKIALFKSAVIKTPWYEKEKLELERKIEHCRGQLEIQLVALMRYYRPSHCPNTINILKGRKARLSWIVL